MTLEEGAAAGAKAEGLRKRDPFVQGRALGWFLLAGYLRSRRVLYPLTLVFLLTLIMFLDRPEAPGLIVGSFGDAAAFLFPVWAWAARGLLDTEPDGQRGISMLAVGRRWVVPVAGVAAAYLVNLGLAAITMAIPVIHGLNQGIGWGVVGAAIALHLLAALAATLVGAWTCRALLPSPVVSMLVLLSACVTLLILSMGSLAWLSVPLIAWVRAAHRGPAAFTEALPYVAAHLAAWSAITGVLYLYVRPRRP